MLPPCIILKSLHPIGQPTCLKKMISVWKRGCPWRKQVFEAPTGPSSFKFKHEDPLGSNKSLVKSSQALPSKTLIADVAQYTQKNIDQISI